VTVPDQPDPSRFRRRPSANGLWPPYRHGAEDDEPADTPLYRTEPDRRLRHRTVFRVGLALIVALACFCVVAITLDALPAALVGAVAILATAVAVAVRISLSR
jgi:hypothetical protein